MEREADQLIMENIAKNMSDADEYPAMMNMHARCISIISHLWGAQKGEKPIGTATTGTVFRLAICQILTSTRLLRSYPFGRFGHEEEMAGETHS